MPTGMGVQRVRVRAYDRYGYRRTTGTGKGVLLERKQAYIRESNRSFAGC